MTARRDELWLPVLLQFPGSVLSSDVASGRATPRDVSRSPRTYHGNIPYLEVLFSYLIAISTVRCIVTPPVSTDPKSTLCSVSLKGLSGFKFRDDTEIMAIGLGTCISLFDRRAQIRSRKDSGAGLSACPWPMTPVDILSLIHVILCNLVVQLTVDKCNTPF